MPRYIVTDEFNIETLEMIPGESYRVGLTRLRAGEKRIEEAFSNIDPISDRVQIRIKDPGIFREVLRLYNESDKPLLHKQGAFRISFLDPDQRADTCPGDTIFVLAHNDGCLDVHEVRLS